MGEAKKGKYAYVQEVDPKNQRPPLPSRLHWELNV